MSYGRVWAGMRWDSYRPEGWWRSWHDIWGDIGRAYAQDYIAEIQTRLDGSF